LKYWGFGYGSHFQSVRQCRMFSNTLVGLKAAFRPKQSIHCDCLDVCSETENRNLKRLFSFRIIKDSEAASDL